MRYWIDERAVGAEVDFVILAVRIMGHSSAKKCMIANLQRTKVHWLHFFLVNQAKRCAAIAKCHCISGDVEAADT